MTDDFEIKRSQQLEARRSSRAAANLVKYPHIVDLLILERTKKLSGSRLWPLYRFLLNTFLGYKRAVKMADAIVPLTGAQAFDYTSDMLNLDVRVTGQEHIPREGAFIMAINHPTGIADGLAIYDAVKPIRPDMKFYANEDAVRLNDKFTDIIIPVPWRRDEKSRAKSRKALVETAKALKGGEALILFPSGRIAFMDKNKQQTEQVWLNSVAALPKKYDVPVIPVHLTARNSWLYYWFWNVNEELRDMTLFHELLNKRGQTFTLKIGAPILPAQLPDDNDVAAAKLRNYVINHLPAGRGWETYPADK